MEKSSAEAFLDQQSMQQTGLGYKEAFEKRQNELPPKIKNDDEYLNSFADEIDKPLHQLQFPLLFSAVVKKSEYIERASTFCAESLMELEETIVDLYRPYVVVLTKHNVEQFDQQNNEEVLKIFSGNHTHVACVQIEEHCLYFPIDKRTSFSEICLQAAKRLPGHIYILDARCGALLYHFFQWEYDQEAQVELLEQIQRLAKITDQYEEVKQDLAEYRQELFKS